MGNQERLPVLRTRIGELMGAQWSASPALLLYSPRRRARSERMPATYPLVQIEPSSRMIPV